MHTVLLLSSVIALAAPPRAREAPSLSESGPQPTLPSVTLTLGQNAVQAEVADSAPERTLGLMRRTDLAQGHGMLFVYPSARPLNFWMRNTLLPLSIAFIRADGVVIRVDDMRPLDESHVPSGGPALYALEVPQGWFDEQDVNPGDRVEGLPGPAPE